MPSVEYEVKGLTGPGGALEKAQARVRGTRGLSEQIRDLIEDAGETAKAVMLARVPRSDGPGNPGKTIASSIRSTSAVFHPGGSGGGGFYEVEVGPGPDAPGHLKFVLEGTGLKVGRGNIRSTTGRAMPMGNGIFRQSQSGQEPNTEWLKEGQTAAREHIAAGIHRLNT